MSWPKKNLKLEGQLWSVNRAVLSIASLLTSFLLTTSVALADYEDSAKHLYGTVMSPFCPGRLLSDCPSEQASLLKETILEDLKKGSSEEAILAELESKYGSEIRAMPTVSGMGLVAWIVPPLFFVGVLGAGAIWLGRRKAQ
jgi:cytochrome c-type biogenesis protein CcmH